jgi:sulfur relay (sulfurtransferase) DsrC/TusE family protein
MPITTLDNHTVHVDEEGFLTEYAEWDAHWKVLRFLREDYLEKGETATTRRVQAVGGVPVKEQFALFPKKPGKKMAYIAGLPKPRGCV